MKKWNGDNDDQDMDENLNPDELDEFETLYHDMFSQEDYTNL